MAVAVIYMYFGGRKNSSKKVVDHGNQFCGQRN
jgi:hypothetical protein